MSSLPAHVAAALTKSKVAWLLLPDEQTVPCWYAGATDAIYVVGGPGEQPIPDLPPRLRIILRNKGTRAAAGPVEARVIRLAPPGEAWDEAVTALLAARQNTPPGDVPARWAAACAVWSIELAPPPALSEPEQSAPDTAPVEAPVEPDTLGEHETGDGATPTTG